MGSICFYPVIRNFVIVIVVITGIADSILVIVLLPRVGEVGAVILEREDAPYSSCRKELKASL